MPKKLQLVIFDCDGVLVESEVVGTRVDQRVLAELGWNLSIDEIVDRFVGGTAENFTREVEGFLGTSLDPRWAEKYKDWYNDAFTRELTAVAGIENALDAVRQQTCVASNGDHARIRHSLALTGLLDRFRGRIFSADDVAQGKPAPDLFLHAAATMGVDPSRCVVVEDSRYGVEAALAAGMTVLGYAGGLTPAEWLHGAGAQVFSSMDDLPELIRCL